jgi:hypothetical protein
MSSVVKKHWPDFRAKLREEYYKVTKEINKNGIDRVQQWKEALS